jgi:hypothetical protein
MALHGLSKIEIERSAAERLEAIRSEARELRLRTRALSNLILEENGLLQKHGITNERLVATSIQCVNASIALGLMLEEDPPGVSLGMRVRELLTLTWWRG